jgi:hypothetical protein
VSKVARYFCTLPTDQSKQLIIKQRFGKSIRK